MSESGHRPQDQHGAHGHAPGDHDHGPPIWRGLMSWIYPIISRNPASNRLVVELAGLRTDDHVLDIGCGPGAAVRAAAALVMESIGADPSERMLRVARRRSRGIANVRFVQAPAHCLPFDDGAFTVAWTIHSVHHWGDERAGMDEVRRVLAPGGSLLIIETLDPTKPWGIDEAGADRIAGLLGEAGFGEVEWATHRAGRGEEAVIRGRV